MTVTYHIVLYLLLSYPALSVSLFSMTIVIDHHHLFAGLCITTLRLRLKNTFIFIKKVIHYGDGDEAGIPEPVGDGDEIRFFIPTGYG
jgi:hypothetical protein